MHSFKSFRTSANPASLSIKPLVAALIALAIASQAHASVTGGSVAAGSATINTQGATTTINQSSDRAVINWRSFDVGAGEKVQINQPTSTSAILNRVDGSLGATRIDGEINANGQVFLVNAKGISVGSSGKINAAGVVLSSLDIGDGNFMQKPFREFGSTLYFRRVGSAPEASVVNDGTITAGDAGISLFGGQVINNTTGILQAAGGLTGSSSGTGDINALPINLVAADSIAADQYTISSSGTYRLLINGLLVDTSKVSSSLGAQNLVANDGTINVLNGPVLLKAAQNSSEIAVRNTGVINATHSLASPLRPYGRVTIESGNGAVYVGGDIRTAADVTLTSSRAPLIVDGSIIADSRVLMNAYNNGNIAINAGANVQSGRDILVLAYGPSSSISNEGELSAPNGVTVADKLNTQ